MCNYRIISANNRGCFSLWITELQVSKRVQIFCVFSCSELHWQHIPCCERAQTSWLSASTELPAHSCLRSTAPSSELEYGHGSSISQLAGKYQYLCKTNTCRLLQAHPLPRLLAAISWSRKGTTFHTSSKSWSKWGWWISTDSERESQWNVLQPWLTGK